MKNRFLVATTLISAIVLGSCSTSNEVVGGGFLQKRKYNKGFYFNGRSGNQESASTGSESNEVVTVKAASSEENTVRTADQTYTGTQVRMEDKAIRSSVEQTTTAGKSGSENVAVNKKVSNVDVKTTSVETSRAAKTMASVKEVIKAKKMPASPAGDVNTILLVILAILLPPLAVFLFEGATSRFWIDLVLALVGLGVGFWLLGPLAWVCGLVAVIYALLIVLSVI